MMPMVWKCHARQAWIGPLFLDYDPFSGERGVGNIWQGCLLWKANAWGRIGIAGVAARLVVLEEWERRSRRSERVES